MKNIKFDFNPYDDVAEVLEYDGFISPSGYYYKVRRSMSNDSIDHDMWAKEYLEKIIGLEKIISNISGSLLLGLTQMNSYVFTLVHMQGFVYYSHDPISRGPIIIAPNPRINNRNMTKEQNDLLFSIMCMNGEDAFNNPVLNGEDTEYVAIDRRRRR